MTLHDLVTEHEKRMPNLKHTAELDDALIPLEYLPAWFGVSRQTIHAWLRADNITTHAFKEQPGADTRPGKAVNWKDIREASNHPTRWKVRDR